MDCDTPLAEETSNLQKRKRTCLLSLLFSNGLLELKRIAALRLDEGIGQQVLVCLNPHSYIVAKSDDLFEEALHRATWVVPDGIGTMIAANVFGRRVRERITGFDSFLAIHGLSSPKKGLRMFYLGSTEKVLQKITDRIHLEYPSVRVVGVHSPSYSIRIGEKENQNIISKINSANPDCLWVAMTAPKQEKWIQENRHRINARIIGAVGAVFDYYARETVYPSRIVRRMGMEWAARLVQQPKRLWKRTFVSVPLFFWHVIFDCYLEKRPCSKTEKKK